jgi:hypothetical protein
VPSAEPASVDLDDVGLGTGAGGRLRGRSVRTSLLTAGHRCEDLDAAFTLVDLTAE